MSKTFLNRIGLLFLAFVVVSVWSDPGGSAQAAGNFLHSVGGFFSTADSLRFTPRGFAGSPAMASENCGFHIPI